MKISLSFLGRVERFKIMFRALKHNNFKLFIEGQSLSLIGTWIQRIAVNWLAFKITDSLFWLGAVNFTSSIPFFIFAPIGGVIADRWSKHRILLITQTMALFQALIFALLFFLGDIKIWQILLLNLFLGTINAIDMPVRQSFVPEMLDNSKEDLQNAIALNSTIFNTARLIGPSIAGVLIATVGEGWCFIINSISFVAVVLSLLKMNVKYTPLKDAKKHILRQLQEGAKYSFTTIPIKYFLFLVMVMGTVGSVLPTLAPAFARICLNGNSETYGFLIGAWGIGALFSAIYLLNREKTAGLENIAAFAATLFGVGIILLSFSRTSLIAMFFIGISGTGLLLELASINTLLQSTADSLMRGRVMSFYGLCNRGLSPIGCIISGTLGDIIGIKYTLITCGLICIAASIYYIRKLPIIRIHVQKAFN